MNRRLVISLLDSTVSGVLSTGDLDTTWGANHDKVSSDAGLVYAYAASDTARERTREYTRRLPHVAVCI